MSEIAVAVVGLFGTLIIALIGLYGAKRYNIGPNQDKLVETLKDIVDAQDKRLTQLEKENQEIKIRLQYVESENERLLKLTVSQMVKIQEYQLKLGEGERITTHD